MSFMADSFQNVSNNTLRIKSKYNAMGKAEKKIADWLLQNSGSVISMSISEFAEVCGVSEATIVRFSRKLDYGGYQGLKLAIAQGQVSGYKIIDQNLNEDDNCAKIVYKVFLETSNTLAHTEKILDTANVEAAAKAIINANRIVIFGLGNSASIAIDCQHKLLRAGLDAAAYCDNHMQAIVASHLTEKDVAIGISHSGSSVDIVEALKISKQRNAKTICLTNYGRSPIMRVSDITLFTASEETKFRTFGLTSRIAQLCILNCIYVYIVFNQKQKGITALMETEQAVLKKKY